MLVQIANRASEKSFREDRTRLSVTLYERSPDVLLGFPRKPTHTA